METVSTQMSSVWICAKKQSLKVFAVNLAGVKGSYKHLEKHTYIPTSFFQRRFKDMRIYTS